jgi:hypothetical protein
MEPHIFTIQKREKPYIIMDKGFLQKSNLTMEAKGLLAYLLVCQMTEAFIVRSLQTALKTARKP